MMNFTNNQSKRHGIERQNQKSQLINDMLEVEYYDIFFAHIVPKKVTQ